MDRLLMIARQRGAAVLGLGVSGRAAAEYLLASGVRPLYLVEEKNREAAAELVRRGAILCDTPTEVSFGLLVRSPGIPERHPAVLLAKARGATVTSEIGLWFSASPLPTLAVTGSDGKTTTVSLAHAMLTEAGLRAQLGGNIGCSLLPRLSEEADLALLELSSFQLLDAFPLGRRDDVPRRAALLNLSENHLDFHGTIEHYFAAKQQIFSKRTLRVLPLSLAELGRESEPLPHLFSLSDAALPYPARLYFPHAGEILCRETAETVRRVCSLRGFSLAGEHNLLNLLAAVALCDGSVSCEAMEGAIRGFRAVEHRMTPIGYFRGALCIDSSIDSTPTRTATTLRATVGKGIVLLLGGASKGLSLAPLTDALDGRVRAIYAFGREGERICRAITGDGRYGGELYRFPHFDGAVLAAAEGLHAGDVLLLSPACTSYDEFHDYTERGRRFRALLGLDGKGTK